MTNRPKIITRQLKITADAVESLKGEVDGLYGRLPPEMMRLVRRIADAANYDLAAMELLDGLELEWRTEEVANA
jgi:hypothetical protein